MSWLRGLWGLVTQIQTLLPTSLCMHLLTQVQRRLRCAVPLCVCIFVLVWYIYSSFVVGVQRLQASFCLVLCHGVIMGTSPCHTPECIGSILVSIAASHVTRDLVKSEGVSVRPESAQWELSRVMPSLWTPNTVTDHSKPSANGGSSVSGHFQITLYSVLWINIKSLVEGELLGRSCPFGRHLTEEYGENMLNC